MHKEKNEKIIATDIPELQQIYKRISERNPWTHLGGLHKRCKKNIFWVICWDKFKHDSFLFLTKRFFAFLMLVNIFLCQIYWHFSYIYRLQWMTTVQKLHMYNLWGHSCSTCRPIYWHKCHSCFVVTIWVAGIPIESGRGKWYWQRHLLATLKLPRSKL